MASRLKTAVMALALCLLSACAASGPDKAEAPDTGIRVEGFIIRNDLNYTVNDVLVEAPASGRFAGCGNIMPRSDCRTSFQALDYEENPIVVSWKEHGNPMAMDEFQIELPEDAARGDSYWLEVVIYAPGLAGARFTQP